MEHKPIPPRWTPLWLLSLLILSSVPGRAQTGVNGPPPNVFSSCSPDCNALIPADATNVVAAAATGGPGGLALRPDGTIDTWGTMAQAPAGLTGIVAISAQIGAGLVLRSNGTVTSWGGLANAASTAQFEAGLSGVTAIACGYSHRMALLTNGTVAVWGSDYAVSLGVAPTLTNIVAIASGVNHCLALKADGTVVAWGPDFSGECDVPPGLNRVVAIAGGINHSLALKADGTIVAWGDTYNGETVVPPSLGPVQAIAAGSELSVALLADGTVAGWGLFCPPFGLSGQVTNVAAITASDQQWVGLLGAGPVVLTSPLINRTIAQGSTVDLTMTAVGAPPLGYQWRFNGANLPGATTRILSLTNVQPGQAGNYSVVVSNPLGSVESPSALVSVPGLAITVQPESQQGFIGGNLTLTVGAAGTAPISYQWQFQGTNLPGCNSSSLTLTKLVPAQAGVYSVVVSNPSGTVTSVPATVYLSQYQVLVWGTNGVPPNLDLTAVASGQGTFLALRRDGTTVAWGPSSQGGKVPANAVSLSAIASGGNHNLGLMTNGTILGWYSGASTATAVSGPTNPITNPIAIAAGVLHSLALQEDGTVVTWGATDPNLAAVPANATNVVGIAGGLDHSLVVRGDGTVIAWGDDTYGQMDVPAGLTNAVAVAAGFWHSLALKADGTVAAWGRNLEGQTTVPAGLTNVVAISGGAHHSLALLKDGTVVAWGSTGKVWSQVPAGLGSVVQAVAGQDSTVVLLGNGPPVLTSQVASRTVLQGSTPHLRATASGSLPLSYQWQFNGVNLSGATNPVLSLTNIQPSQAGAYSVLVTNSQGTGASRAQAMVRVNHAPPPAFVRGSYLLTNGSFQFSMQASPGSQLEVLSSSDLQNWTSLATLAVTNSPFSFTDSTANATFRFYRAKLLP